MGPLFLREAHVEARVEEVPPLAVGLAEGLLVHDRLERAALRVLPPQGAHE